MYKIQHFFFNFTYHQSLQGYIRSEHFNVLFEKDDEKLKNKKLYLMNATRGKLFPREIKRGVYVLGSYLFFFFFSWGGYTLFFVCFNLYHHCHITFQGTLQIGCSLANILCHLLTSSVFFTNNGKFKIEITTFQYVVKMIIFFYTVTMFWYQFLMIGGKKQAKQILVAQCSSWYCCTKKWRYV